MIIDLLSRNLSLYETGSHAASSLQVHLRSRPFPNSLFNVSKGALTPGQLFRMYLLPRPPLPYTHIGRAPPMPEQGYLFYIHP